MKNDRNSKRSYRLLFLCLLALAIVSNAVQDLARVYELVSGVSEMTHSLTAGDLFSAKAAARHPVATVQQSSAQEFRWSGAIAPGKKIEIRGLNGAIAAEGSSGNLAAVAASKSARRSDVNTVMIKVVEHPGGVIICAVYPTDIPGRMTSCEPARNLEQVHVEEPANVLNNDVEVNFRVQVPAGVDFVGRTVNGEINVGRLASNAETKTVNGNINVATTGYARAKTVNGKIFARLGDANWTGALEFKTVNGEIDIELPSWASAEISASTFNGAINSDFPLIITAKRNKRQMSGSIGATGSGRELLLKTLNGNINLKRVG